MTKETMYFKYHKPVYYLIANVVCIVLFMGFAFYSLQNYEFPKALALLAVSFLIVVFTLYFSEKHLTDLRGRFIFSEDRFEISSQFINQIITYNSIESISREYYDVVFLLGTRAVPSQFRIVCADGKNIVFRIAKSEEKRYITSVKKISREIYKTNRLGVHFASKFTKELSTVNEKNKLFDKLKPVPHYSLEKAINLMLEKTNLILEDFTIVKTN